MMLSLFSSSEAELVCLARFFSAILLFRCGARGEASYSHGDISINVNTNKLTCTNLGIIFMSFILFASEQKQNSLIPWYEHHRPCLSCLSEAEQLLTIPVTLQT